MWRYVAPLHDMRFVIDELLDVRSEWAHIKQFANLDSGVVSQILEEAGKFANGDLSQINSSGDAQGCRYDAGRVMTPCGFADAYRQYRQGGWPSLACDPQWGGQGLPQVLNAALYEMLNSVNHAWTMYPGIAHGAYQCLLAHASEAVKAVFLPKIVSGEWLTTMCLTEPQAGSDVGLVRSTAAPNPDDTYAVNGTKIFISGGEHDLTDNILHLVLARLPEAPPGTRGISLFLVPKCIPYGAALLPNSLRCDGIERKMGIHGSATCTMTFSAATGWLIGEPHRGLAAMFVMMNSARLYVGLQGLGHAEMASQNARRYAQERLQMRSVNTPDAGEHQASSGPEPIARHPMIRRTLMTLRAFVEGQRALGLWCAHLLDMAEHHPDPSHRSRAHDLASLLTPIIKSFFTENGFVLSSAAMQVWGGYGYTHDFGIEQSVRDSRIAMIYEGTNEIQAIDLLARKVIGDGGAQMTVILDLIQSEADLCHRTAHCAELAEQLRSLHDSLQQATARIITEFDSRSPVVHEIASDYLRLAALSLLAALWGRAARMAAPRAADEAFYRAKFETAGFYFDYLLPETRLRLEIINKVRRPLAWVK